MRRSAFVVFLLGACIATAATVALMATSEVARGAAIAAPLLAGVLLLVSRRSRAGRPRKLADRIRELTEELQRERIETANRFADLEARVNAVEDAQLQVGEARTRHREELRQIREALAAHHTAIDLTVAGHRA